jgi:hypothetical protein
MGATTVGRPPETRAMRPEIKRYLDENGARYTSEALRGALLQVGHDPAEVDAALQEWQSEHAGAFAGEESRRRFRRWTIWLHLGVLLAVFVLVILLDGAQASAVAPAAIAAGVLAVLLLLGWAISSMIGRALLPRTGIAVALIVPVISALGLGGTCLAIMSGSPFGRPPPPTVSGTMQLTVQPPMSFEGSGHATCQGQPGVSMSVFAENLGTLEGANVSVSLDRFEQGAEPNARRASGSSQDVNLSITLSRAPDNPGSQGWLRTSDTQLSLDAAADGLSGTIVFQDLGPVETGDPNAPAGGQPISGSVSWTCQGG